MQWDGEGDGWTGVRGCLYHATVASGFLLWWVVLGASVRCGARSVRIQG